MPLARRLPPSPAPAGGAGRAVSTRPPPRQSRYYRDGHGTGRSSVRVGRLEPCYDGALRTSKPGEHAALPPGPLSVTVTVTVAGDVEASRRSGAGLATLLDEAKAPSQRGPAGRWQSDRIKGGRR